MLTPEMMVVLGLLAFAIFLFATEIIRIDLAAILIMVLLGLFSFMPGLDNIVDISRLFDGFASNAVISIIAIMIIGAGLDKSGLMTRVAKGIFKVSGSSERRVIPIISGTVGIISSFMQNIGAAALFLPVVSRISGRTQIPMRKLLMPMGFCAILGGTVTLIGSSPLILLNDLIATSNESLPEGEKMSEFGLFSVTPVGLALIFTGILYFVFFGRWVLPDTQTEDRSARSKSIREYMKRLYGLDTELFEVVVPEGNLLVGNTIVDIMDAHNIDIIGTYHKGLLVVAPVISTEILTPSRLAVLGERSAVEYWAEPYGLEIQPKLEYFAEDFAPTNAGVAEIVIPPGSALIGKTLKERQFRKSYGLNVLAIHRGEETFSRVKEEQNEANPMGYIPLQAGDTMIVQTKWTRLTRLLKNRDFVVVTSDFPQEEFRPHKSTFALVFFALALGLVLFSSMPLALCLLVGAVGMIIAQVLNIEEAYQSVSWSTVFLLASLIPLGQAMQMTGTAEWIAGGMITALDGWPTWSLQLGIAILATILTLVMSNVGATVLLVPLAVSVAVQTGADPAIFAMIVAISTSNSFILPTHQVNALIMGPAGYKVMDFARAGGVMTILFLAVSLVMINLVF